MDTIVTMHTLIIPIPMPSINFFFFFNAIPPTLYLFCYIFVLYV